MKHLSIIARSCYALCIGCLGVQQFIYKDFRPVILPEWPGWIHHSPWFAFIVGAALLVAAIMISFEKMGGMIEITLGIGMLIFFLAFHVPNQIFIIPYKFHLGLWTDALKELALAGGAFILAVFSSTRQWDEKSIGFRLTQDQLMRLGKIFFSTTMISFGIDHFLYTESISNLVPAWIPDHIFWTYFAGIALIGSGTAIVLNIFVKQVAILLSMMLLLWVILLHIPRAIADPHVASGNEITSAFEALAFSGISLTIAIMSVSKVQSKLPELTQTKVQAK